MNRLEENSPPMSIQSRSTPNVQCLPVGVARQNSKVTEEGRLLIPVANLCLVDNLYGNLENNPTLAMQKK